ncbi:hypothetical protein FB45DRAFT_1037151 [Roridomyces roridus]|uniref:Uncharacterized protein n=1 Tax=Roridomyces roridus TaxID=1738132 RepID=A0AAD7B7I4_9AGAR|nr:hypothetical protein FB45DRAFT_1037151 [Roridomyces roridus]
MPRPVGRPPLEPAEKERRRKKSKAEYEDRNHDLRRRKAPERIQRKRASLAKNPITHFKAKRKAAQHSEGFRDRKLAETQAATREEKAKQATTNRQRKEEVYEKHLLARRQREAASAPRTTPFIAGLSLSAIHAAESDDKDLLTTNFPAEPCSPVTDIFTRPAHPMCCAHCFSRECIGCASQWISHFRLIDAIDLGQALGLPLRIPVGSSTPMPLDEDCGPQIFNADLGNTSELWLRTLRAWQVCGELRRTAALFLKVFMHELEPEEGKEALKWTHVDIAGTTEARGRRFIWVLGWIMTSPGAVRI